MELRRSELEEQLREELTDTGKPIYKNVLARTRAEVKEKLRAAMDLSEKVDVTQQGKYTFGEWMDVWYESYCVI